MADQVELDIKFSFRHEHLKKGHHTFLLPLEPEVENLVGKVVIYWGAFELRMDTVTDSVTAVMGKHATPLPSGWRRQPFVKRKALFKSVLTGYTRLMFPDWESRVRQLADQSGDLHWRRNLVAHGYYQTEPVAGSQGEYRFRAYGDVKGQRRSLLIDVDTLNKIWHDIAHLLGDLMSFVNHTGATTNAIDLVIPDDDILREGKQGSVRVLAVSDAIPPALKPFDK